MTKINYQALREKAEKATSGVWSLEYGEERFDAGDALIHREVVGYLPICRIEGAHPESGFDEDFQMEQQANAEFIAAANPATVLALLDERERNQQYIKRRDQENEDIALTVGRLRVELEGKDSKIANLTAERDALREGEMGDARHSNTRAAADIYFQLVEECEIPAGGSLVEYVDDMREKLEAAEKRIAELSSAVIAPGIMRCAGCGLVLTKNSINMVAGTITAGDSKTEPCPNGCGPLWPVTWKEQAIEMRDNSEQWFEELQEARQRIAELELKLEAADKLQDSAFRHGLQHGFSYGQTDDQAGFEKAIQAYGQQ